MATPRDCKIQPVLDRLHGMVHAAMHELEASPTRYDDWRRITKNAQMLLGHMPNAAGHELALTAFAFLAALDKTVQN